MGYQSCRLDTDSGMLYSGFKQESLNEGKAVRTSLPILLGVLLCLFRTAAMGTEEYSELTGKGCVHCHIYVANA